MGDASLVLESSQSFEKTITKLFNAIDDINSSD